MKNLAIAIGILVIVILLAFLFKNKTEENNTKIMTTNSPLPINQLTATPSAKKSYSNPPQVLPKEEISGKKAKIKTEKGEIVFELLTDAPLASSNFIFLTEEGFYDELTFHRREEGFVIQGGDPYGNGTGGPGYKFNDEPVTLNYDRGIVAMANSGPNTNGSQFFIMLADTSNLPKNYTIFGKVIGGMETVDKISIGDIMEKVTIE